MTHRLPGFRHVDESLPDEARFGMLVPIREFGRELVDVAERRALRHARYYAAPH